MEALRPCDLQTLLGWLSPDYMIPAAQEAGVARAVELWGAEEAVRQAADDPRFLAVLGAHEAYLEVRAQIRSYARYVRWREGARARDLGLAQALRRAGYMGNFQVVYPFPLTDWRSTAWSFWPRGEGRIPGDMQVPVGAASQRLVDLACVKAISECLRAVPEVNRALLQGRCWRRVDTHVMLHLMPAPEQVRSVVLDAARLSLPTLRRRLSQATKAIVRAERSELKPFSDELLQLWAKPGFIGSPAGAMISCVGSSGVYKGKAALLADVNGIPLAFTVGRVENGYVWITADVDHRAIDGPQMGHCYRFLEKRIVELLDAEGQEPLEDR